MNPYPGPQSVLILDNCKIHKSEILREIIEAQGEWLVASETIPFASLKAKAVF